MNRVVQLVEGRIAGEGGEWLGGGREGGGGSKAVTCSSQRALGLAIYAEVPLYMR